MAKKTFAAQQLVHIPAPKAGSAALSKEQKAFNRLTKHIARLEAEAVAFREAGTRLRQQVQDEYRPLQARHNEQRAAFVRVLDQAHDTQKLTKTERGKIVDLIVHGCADLLDRGHADLEPIFDKYDPPLSPEELAEEEAAHAEADAQALEMMKQMLSAQYNIKFDPAADVSTPEKFQAYVARHMAEQQETYDRQEAEAAERRAQRRKTPKQQAAEDKRKTEEKNLAQAVRTLYMDLVKHLHPDREPDEAEKLRKTELLQRVTAAYESNELLTLLRLQLELERIDQAHLETLAESQLRYYNKLLREQAQTLERSLQDEQMELAAFTGQPWYMLTHPADLERGFQRQKQQLEAKITQLAANVERCAHDLAALKDFLKTYKIPKAGPGPLFVPMG